MANKTAYSYARWSTLEQGNSDRSSEERQLLACAENVRRNGWTPAETLIDSGHSAYTGANLTKGNLGIFTARILSGAIEASDTVLVVEEMDRLSRRPPGEMTAWLTPLLNLGLTVSVANTGQIVTKDILNNDFGAFVSLMSQSFSAYEFSRKQALRGSGSWTKRRKAYAEEGKALSRHRGRKWLAWDAANKEWAPIAERVDIIHEMFRMRLSGIGKGTIAKTFNERAVAGDDRYVVWVSTIKRQPTLWTTSAVARIVQDPAVTGYLQWHLSPRIAKKRTPLGDPQKVYPEVVDQETFARANDLRLVNQLKTQGRGRNVSNLLGPLAKCGGCGAQMSPLGSSRIRTNKDGSTSQHYFLYCLRNKMTKGAECDHSKGWTYSKVEGPLLDGLLVKALDDQFFKTDDKLVTSLEGRVAVLRRQLIAQEKSAKRIIAMVRDDDGADGPDEFIMEEYATARERITETKAAITQAQGELEDARGKTTQGAHVVRVSELRDKMDSEDVEERFLARTTVKMALRNIIESMVFEPDTRRVVVNLISTLGVMFIREDGSYSFFDLLHRGRAMPIGKDADERDAIRGYMERTKTEA